MAELTLLLLLLAVTGLAVAWPLLDRDARVPPAAATDAPDEERQVRHRLALEALRDLEADRRAGSIDGESYLAQRAEAEALAAATLPADQPRQPAGSPEGWHGRRVAALLGGAIIALVLAAFALPAPFGIAERTVPDQALADAVTAEEARQAEISRLQARISADPTDAGAFSDLADAFLAGPTLDDKRRGAAALLVLINLEPENAYAYRRLITAYIQTGSWEDANGALDAYADFAPVDEPDIPFFRGLIALRGDGDEEEAVRQFDRFLGLAPHDPRAPMVISLREQASGTEPSPS